MGSMKKSEWSRLGLYAATGGTYALVDPKTWGAGGKKNQADPAKPAPPPDATDEAVQAARLFERRQQLGLMGRMSTFLTTGQRQQAPATPQSVNPPTTFLGQ